MMYKLTTVLLIVYAIPGELMGTDVEKLTDWRQLPPHVVKSDAELDANQATQLFASLKQFKAIMDEHHQPKPFFVGTYQKANEADTLMSANGTYSEENSVRADLPSNDEMATAWRHWAMIGQKMLDFAEIVTRPNIYGEMVNSDTIMGHLTSSVEADIVLQRYFLTDCDEGLRSGELSYAEFKQKFIDHFVGENAPDRAGIPAARVMLHNFIVDHTGTVYEGFENIAVESESLLQAWYVHARAEIVIEQQQELLAQIQADDSQKPIETSALNPVDVENVASNEKSLVVSSN